MSDKLIHPYDTRLIHEADKLMARVQEALEQRSNFISKVVMVRMPKDSDSGLVTRINARAEQTSDDMECGQIVRSYQVKHAVIQSPQIDLNQLVSEAAYEDVIKITARISVENLLTTWDTAFFNEFVAVCENKSLAPPSSRLRKESGMPLADGISFFGKPVPAFITKDTAYGAMVSLNPKFKWAARRYIEFDKDTVHFVFPDPAQWAGKMRWYNVRDLESNPDGVTGCFRISMSFAAKPVRPDLGRVIVATPSGLYGRLMYWAWKLVGFQP